LAQYVDDPITILSYPVFDSFAADRQVVGVLGTTLYWRLLFTEVLPPTGKTDIVVVVENSFGQAESYRIDGPEVTYLGQGDLHDPKYDDMKLTENVVDYVTSKAGPESRSFTAVDLNTQYVRYNLTVYPSADMEAQFVNNDPIVYAVLVALIFVFTTVVFLLFNWLVERRQSIVLDKAVKSTAVVRSLFPENVQQRIYDETEEDPTHISGTSRSGAYGPTPGNSKWTRSSFCLQE
jgi:hypothetical protein